MLGETDGLKSLGISISQAEIDQRLLEKGQQDLTGAARQQAEAIATQELIIEKTTDAQKAWSDGTMDNIKAQNEARASVEELKVAVSEKLLVAFTAMTAFVNDYLIPTILDTPNIPVDVLELADEHAPYGLRGVGEAPTLSSTPAVLAAIRDATGLELNRTPVRPEHLTGTA